MIENIKDLKVGFGSIGFRFDPSPDCIALPVLIKKAIEGGSPVSHFFQEGYSDKAYETLLKKIFDLHGRKIYESSSSGTELCVYAWDNALVELSISKSKMVTINVVSANESVTVACKDAAALFSTPTKTGYIFAITRNSQGLQITRVGYAGRKLERNNYTDGVCKDFDFAVEDLRSKDPMGRILILDGPPGTGKTHFIRGIFMDVPNAMFVIVPPSMMSSIVGPELLPLLLKTKDNYGKKGPIILVLEDADQCLAPRESDNISSISSILNLGDGIFGSLLDIRILATTNAKAKDLDWAITRDMRLSKRILIDLVSYEQANRIYKGIIGNPSADMPKPSSQDNGGLRPQINKKTFSLAEIYKIARVNGWKPQLKEDEVKVEIEEPDYYDGSEYV